MLPDRTQRTKQNAEGEPAVVKQFPKVAVEGRP